MEAPAQSEVLNSKTIDIFSPVRLFSSYQGSKIRYLQYLQRYAGQQFVEPFAGSASLSINLSAPDAILNDTDPFICKILSRFDELIVPEIFNQKDYEMFKSGDEFWKHSYCLTAMSFSGLFRWSRKSGFNAPLKKSILGVSLKESYEAAKEKWIALKPIVSNLDYLELPAFTYLDKVVVCDPPFADSYTSYNEKHFDWNKYSRWVREVVCPLASAVIVFERVGNLIKFGVPVLATRRMNVNGARRSDDEGMAIFENGKWLDKL